MRKSRSKYLKASVTQEQRQLISEFCRDLVKKIRSYNPDHKRTFDWFHTDSGLCFNFKCWYIDHKKTSGSKIKNGNEVGKSYTLYFGFKECYPFGDMEGPLSSNKKRQGFIYSMASKNKS